MWAATYSHCIAYMNFVWLIMELYYWYFNVRMEVKGGYVFSIMNCGIRTVHRKKTARICMRLFYDYQRNRLPSDSVVMLGPVWKKSVELVNWVNCCLMSRSQSEFCSSEPYNADHLPAITAIRRGVSSSNLINDNRKPIMLDSMQGIFFAYVELEMCTKNNQ